MVQNMITLNYANMITLNGIESISGLVHRCSHRLFVWVRQVRRPVQQQADKGDDVNNKLTTFFVYNKQSRIFLLEMLMHHFKERLSYNSKTRKQFVFPWNENRE